jgi:hypothetical protein
MAGAHFETAMTAFKFRLVFVIFLCNISASESFLAGILQPIKNTERLTSIS